MSIRKYTAAFIGSCCVLISALVTPGAIAQTAPSEPSESVEEAASNVVTLTGDPAKGKIVFYQCLSCHSIKEGQNKLGPSLYGVIGRPAGAIDGFNYSDANKNSGIVWSEEVIFAYLEDPRAYLPGTRMIFRGVPKEQDRADVIAYLKSVSE